MRKNEAQWKYIIYEQMSEHGQVEYGRIRYSGQLTCMEKKGAQIRKVRNVLTKNLQRQCIKKCYDISTNKHVHGTSKEAEGSNFEPGGWWSVVHKRS